MGTHRMMGGLIKYGVEMGSGAMLRQPSFIKICSNIQKLIGVYNNRQQGDLIRLLSFFRNKENSLKMGIKIRFLEQMIW
jgi:hypothetical protein